jgi:hypothetical protein
MPVVVGSTSVSVLSTNPTTLYPLCNRFGINPIYGLFDEYNLDFYVQSIDDQVVFRKNGKKYSKKKVRKERRNMQKFVRKCLDKAGNDWFDEYLSPNGTTSLDMSAKRILKQCNYTDGWTAGNDLLRKAMAYIYAGGTCELTCYGCVCSSTVFYQSFKSHLCCLL